MRRKALSLFLVFASSPLFAGTDSPYGPEFRKNLRFFGGETGWVFALAETTSEMFCSKDGNAFTGVGPYQSPAFLDGSRERRRVNLAGELIGGGMLVQQSWGSGLIHVMCPNGRVWRYSVIEEPGRVERLAKKSTFLLLPTDFFPKFIELAPAGKMNRAVEGPVEIETPCGRIPTDALRSDR